MVIQAKHYDTHDITTPFSIDKQRIQSYLRSSGQTEMLKIQDLVTNGSQDARLDGTLLVTDQLAMQTDGYSNVTSSDIR